MFKDIEVNDMLTLGLPNGNIVAVVVEAIILGTNTIIALDNDGNEYVIEREDYDNILQVN